MSKQTVKIKRYPILSFVGYLYKVFAVLAVIAAIGGTTLRFADLFFTPYYDRNYTEAWAQIALMLSMGGIIGLVCGTLGQIIDVILATNEYMRQIADQSARNTKILYAAHPDIVKNLNRVTTE
jgi:cytochrome c oxidase assembly factor CtaG